MKTCMNCGSKLKNHAMFCPNCGMEIAPEVSELNAFVPGTNQAQHQYAPWQQPNGMPRQMMKKKMSRGKKVGLIFLGIFAFLMMLVFIGILSDINKGKLYDAEFAQSVLTEGRVKPELEYVGQNKLVLCEPGINSNSWDFGRIIPSAYTSSKVEDVGGIVIRNSRQEVVATYTGNKKVSYAIYTLKILDPYTGVIIATETFIPDKEPPKTIYSDGYVIYPKDKYMREWVDEVWTEYCGLGK